MKPTSVSRSPARSQIRSLELRVLWSSVLSLEDTVSRHTRRIPSRCHRAEPQNAGKPCLMADPRCEGSMGRLSVGGTSVSSVSDLAALQRVCRATDRQKRNLRALPASSPTLSSPSTRCRHSPAAPPGLPWGNMDQVIKLSLRQFSSRVLQGDRILDDRVEANNLIRLDRRAREKVVTRTLGFRLGDL